MSVRLVDIARKTGYSVSTVSRALHNKSSKSKISETAIAKMTGQPAAMLGLQNRGLLCSGYAADLIIFDETFRDLATFNEPERYPEGLHYVFINGEIKLKEGVYHENRSGKILATNSTLLS